MATVTGPQHLATKQTELKNDPLHAEAFFPAESSKLSSTAEVKRFYPGADGVTQITEREYNKLSAHSFSLKRNISASMYAYYCGVLTYARMLDLHGREFGALSDEEKSFIQLARHFRPPKMFSLYLAGFGNTTFPLGFSKQHFSMLKPTLTERSPGVLPGYFGTMKEHAMQYASYPCLAVFAMRIMKDLEVAGEWNLPPAYAYGDRALTSACLAYVPGVQLDRSVLATLSQNRITTNYFPVSFRTICYSPEVMSTVQTWIDEIKGIQLGIFPEGETGSQGQLVGVSVDDPSDHYVDVDDHYEDRIILNPYVPKIEEVAASNTESADKGFRVYPPT